MGPYVVPRDSSICENAHETIERIVGECPAVIGKRRRARRVIRQNIWEQCARHALRLSRRISTCVLQSVREAGKETLIVRRFTSEVGISLLAQRCAWTPPNCKHAARSVGGAAGLMVDLCPEICRRLPKAPCMFNASELLFAIVHRMVGWDLRQPLNTAKKRLITTLRDEIRQPDERPLRLTIPREERLARVADALLDDVGDDRTLDAWAHVAGMARRTFMRAFSAQAGMSFGRWRQQARLFAALEMLAQNKSVTEVAIQKHTQSSSKAPIPAYLLGILAMAERGDSNPRYRF